MPRDALRVALTWQVRRDLPCEPLLRRAAHRAAAAESFRGGELSLVIVGARAMAALHRRFLGRADATDVLSFDLGSDPRGGVLHGEIVLCADTARRAVRGATRVDPRRMRALIRGELCLYLVHGILHLAGYDDALAADFERMHAREEEILRSLRIACIPVTAGAVDYHSGAVGRRPTRGTARGRSSVGRATAF
jgi:probable rRNA maturation factor